VNDRRRKMTSRDSCVIRRLLSIVVHFLLTFAAAADTCSFPDYLQSRDGARRWRSHVTFTDGDRCVWRDVSFVGDVWETRVTSGHCPPHDTDSATLTSSYRRRCVKSLNRQRHIVRHRFVTGNTSRYDVNRQQQDGYSCVEFVRRGPTVVQLRESMPTWTTTRFLETACGDAVAGLTLALDGWLLVDYGPAFFQSDEQCPFVDGGFSVRVFDKLFRRGVCDAFNDETRVESRCSADENDRIHFRFRYRECVPEGLGMGVNQPAYCLASWTDDEAGVFAYTLLRHQYSQRTWCLRYPAAAVSRQSAQRRRPFSAFLFRDAFCDHGRTSVATERYLLVDFTPSSGDGDDDSSEGVVDGRLLCRDDYEACAYWGQPCRHAGSAQMLACARRCGICSDDRPAACQMSQHLRGQWSLKLRPSHRQADSAPVSDVVITQHFVQVT